MAALHLSVHQVIIPFSVGVHKVSLAASSEGVCAQHSPPLPVSVPTIMKLNSNHSLPNGGVARVE